jgi:hypothetical protein
MRIVRLAACLVAALAVSAVAAASASALAEYDTIKYPVEEKSTATNFQGFHGTGLNIVCRKATFNTNEEIGKVPAAEAINPVEQSATLVTHPIYSECRGSLEPAGTFPVTVNTEGCNFVTHALKPGVKEASVDIVCAEGKTIVNTFVGLSECTISVFPQTGLKNLEYKNEPGAGTATQEVTTTSEVSHIKSKATSTCGLALGTTEFEAEYREGEIETGGLETAKIAPAGKPASAVSKAFEATGSKLQEAGEVGINEPHWYKNHTPLAAELDTMSWGKLIFKDAGGAGHIGTAECQTEWGGDILNAGPAGAVVGAGNSVAGESKVDAFHAYDCTASVCEAEAGSPKLALEAEGLTAIKEEKAQFGEWEGKLSTVAGPITQMHIGNKNTTPATEIKLHLVCTAGATTTYNKKWKGELTSNNIEAGTSIGSAPAVLTLPAGKVLEVESTLEGEVTNKLKVMGYAGGEILSTKNP